MTVMTLYVPAYHFPIHAKSGALIRTLYSYFERFCSLSGWVSLVDDLSLVGTKFQCFLGFDAHLNSAAAQSWKKQISLEKTIAKIISQTLLAYSIYAKSEKAIGKKNTVAYPNISTIVGY